MNSLFSITCFLTFKKSTFYCFKIPVAYPCIKILSQAEHIDTTLNLGKGLENGILILIRMHRYYTHLMIIKVTEDCRLMH